MDGELRTVTLNRNPSKDGAQQTGIGIIFGRPEVGREASGPYKIHSVASAGTAFQSGLIHAGDLLFKVNGASVLDLTAEQITTLILGKPSSPITLTISTPPALKASSPQLPQTPGKHSLAPTSALLSTMPHQFQSTPPFNVPMTADDIDTGSSSVSSLLANSYSSNRNTSQWHSQKSATHGMAPTSAMSISRAMAQTSQDTGASLSPPLPSLPEPPRPPILASLPPFPPSLPHLFMLLLTLTRVRCCCMSCVFAGYAHRALLPPSMPVAAAEQFAESTSTSAHRPLTELRYGSVNRVRLNASCPFECIVYPRCGMHGVPKVNGRMLKRSYELRHARCSLELRIATRDLFARACLNRECSHICVCAVVSVWA